MSLTHFYLAEDLVKRPLAIDHSEVHLPLEPGLGIVVEETIVERFRAR